MKLAVKYINAEGGILGRVVDTDAMQCGHYIAEEMPDHVYNRFVEFFKA